MNKVKCFLASLKEIFIILFIQYFIIIILSLLLDVNNNIYIVSTILSIFDIIYILYNKKYLNIHFDYKNNYLLYIMLGVSISVIYNMIIYGFKLYNNPINNSILFFDILTSGIIAPIFEEILFRVKFISKTEKIINNKIIVILVTSLVFAILHFNIISGIIAFIVGIINGYIYIKTRDIIKISLIHISLNTMSSLILEYNLIIFILGLILMVISILLFKKKNE